MKTKILSVFLALAAFAHAELDTFSGHKWEVEFDGKETDFDKAKTDQYIKSYKGPKAGLQTGLNALGTGATVFWRANGTLDQVYKEVGNSESSWIWANAVPGKVHMVVTLNPDGAGYVDLFQGLDLVGHFPCQSSALRNQTNGQPNEGETIVWKKDADYENAAGVKMEYCIFIDKPGRMLGMHRGNKRSKSGGCLRIGYFTAPHVFDLMKVGSKVTIKWNK